MSHARSNLSTLSYKSVYDVAGIIMSSMYDVRPSTDGVGLVSGSPSVNTSICLDDSVEDASGSAPIFIYPYNALSSRRW